MPKSIFLKIILAVVLTISFVANANFSQANGSGIFLTLQAKIKTKNPDVTLKGRTGKDTSISIFVNGGDIGNISLDGQNRYHVRVPLEIGDNSIQVKARSGDQEKTIQKNIVRKTKTLFISIVHTKNRILKPDVTVRGNAYGVSEVRISVDGIFQGIAPVSGKKGKFKFRASLDPGVNIIEARADNGLENVTATKRVRRL
jgi:hypothetical protein